MQGLTVTVSFQCHRRVYVSNSAEPIREQRKFNSQRQVSERRIVSDVEILDLLFFAISTVMVIIKSIAIDISVSDKHTNEYRGCISSSNVGNLSTRDYQRHEKE